MKTIAGTLPAEGNYIFEGTDNTTGADRAVEVLGVTGIPFRMEREVRHGRVWSMFYFEDATYDAARDVLVAAGIELEGDD